jgi:hypothetical protein
LRPTWVSCAVNSLGTLGGLLVSWDPNVYDLVPYLTIGGILLTGRCLKDKREVALLNIYGPCTDRLQFWHSVADSGLLEIRNLILVGDLNFVLASDEVWGGAARHRPSDEIFRDLLSASKLIDIKPDKLVPMWHNGREGSEVVARRLDRCLVSKELLLSVGIFRSWVDFPYISDHAPIFL